VFEADRDRAIELVRMEVSVNDCEAVQALAPVTRNELLEQRVKRSDVKQVV
jgi:hypothetical protein